MRSLGARSVLLLVCAVGLSATASSAFEWNLRRSEPCEPPDVFYSPAHDASVGAPCCPRPPHLCPAGVTCVGPSCAAPYEGVPCSPGPPPDRPNVILYLADDQGYCHYGFMAPGCRTSTTGTVIPVPATPNLDRLALQPENEGRGRVFEIAYGNAAWSLPARETIQTGQLRKENVDPRIPRRFIAQQLNQPAGPRYCSFAGGGKLGETDDRGLGYSAFRDERKLGKNFCEAAPCAPGCDDPPRCGADVPGSEPDSLLDVFAFIDATLLGPRLGGALDPNATYTQAQPFFMWYGSALPHVQHKPPAVIENILDPLVPGDYLFSPSFADPTQPRFPFGDPRYAPAFTRAERQFRGLYGMIWWGDDGIRQLRRKLEGIRVWDPSGTRAVSLWERTVFIFMADNGADLPRSKHNATPTQNGYRSPIVIHDGGLPPSSSPTRIAQELTHAVDIMPTVLDYAGHPIPPLPGHSLRPYLGATPPAVPLRNTMCGHETKSWTVSRTRYILTRPGTVGRCAPGAGPSCTEDGECPGGVCLLGACGSGALCLEDDDCPAGESCGLRAQKWCRYGRHPLNETGVPTVDLQPTTPCSTAADCVAGCPSADPINCTCEYRTLKLYVLDDATAVLLDLFVDPDEPGIDKRLRRQGRQPGDVPIAPADPARHLANRLRCCLDRWWTPPALAGGIAFGDPTCSLCEPHYRCHRCGDGIVSSAEQCDGTNLAGASCTSVPGGFTGGMLACGPSCAFETSGCTS